MSRGDFYRGKWAMRRIAAAMVRDLPELMESRAEETICQRPRRALAGAMRQRIVELEQEAWGLRLANRLQHPCGPGFLQDILLLADVDVSTETIGTWTPAQRAEAEEWAAHTHLSASDNPCLWRPAKPAFLPAQEALATGGLR